MSTPDFQGMSLPLHLLQRDGPLFTTDMARLEDEIRDRVSASRFLVIGAAGSIGQAVTKEIFARNPRVLDAVDISENNLAELVRDLRSSFGYISGTFRTFAIDASSVAFDALMQDSDGYDYVLNLSALKHVRSEKDPYTLMRLIEVNLLNTASSLRQARDAGAQKYFCVSTDKAAAPVNLMGASKRLMERFLVSQDHGIASSTARFANVAFSDGSLLHGFEQRLLKQQPLSAPMDVRRFFMTFKEAGVLCLLSTLFGDDLEIFFPKLSENLNAITFSEIAVRFLKSRGYEAVACETEDEARARAADLPQTGKWPCYFFASDTTGEKPIEEFFTGDETLDLDRYQDIGVIKNVIAPQSGLPEFFSGLEALRTRGRWNKSDLLALFLTALPELQHHETGRHLDNRM